MLNQISISSELQINHHFEEEGQVEYVVVGCVVVVCQQLQLLSRIVTTTHLSRAIGPTTTCKLPGQCTD